MARQSAPMSRGRGPRTRGRGRGRPRKRVLDEEDEPAEEEPYLFPVGAEVEVRSDEPGFAGAFYEATVVEHVSVGGGGGYLLSYSTLVQEGGGGGEGSPLRERAAAANVRPRPPRPEPGRVFGMHEMVEAFHNEGWWSGVVSAVPPPPAVLAGDHSLRRYKVAFPTSREVLEFDEAALRTDLLFKDGTWVPSAEADNGRPLFIEGGQVEVSRSAESFGESWNPATVLKVIGATNFLVQYKVGDDGELITEIVDSQYIRPTRTITHMDSKYRFSPSSHVEVFHEGSWWPGVMMKSLSTDFSKKYVVKLRSRHTDMDDVEFEDVLTVENSQLRHRFDWNGRKWVRCMTMEPAKGPPLSSRKREISSALVPCSDSAEIRDRSGSCLDIMVKNPGVVSGPVPSHLAVCRNNNEIKHKLCSYLEKTVMQQHAVLALGSQLAPPFPLHSSSHAEVSSSQIIPMPSRPQTGQPQASLFGSFGQLRSLPKGPVLGMQLQNPDFGNVAGLKNVLTDHKRQSTDEICYLLEDAEFKNSPVESCVETDLSQKRKQHVALQTPEESGGNLEIRKKRMMDKTMNGTNIDIAISTEGQQESWTVDKIKPSGTDDIHEVLSITSTVDNCDPGAVNVLCSDFSTQNGMKAANDNIGTSVEQDTCEEFSQRFVAMDDTDTRVILLPSPKSHGVAAHDHELHKDSIAATTGCTASVAPAENLSTLSPVDVGNSTEAEIGNSLPSAENVEGTPIYKYVANRTHNSCGSLLQRSVAVHETIMADRPSDSLAIVNLPFVKSFTLWEKIDAMEIFTELPQRPNFNQLQQHVPELREGLALGLMLSFANLAESIKKLSLEHENVLFEEKMRGLSSLEAEGFNVGDLRSRVETLLCIKNTRTELQFAMNKLEEKIASKETGDQQIGAQIGMLSVALHQLELHAFLLRCRMKSAVLQKMNSAVEISGLRMEATELERSYHSAWQRFNSTVSAPW